MTQKDDAKVSRRSYLKYVGGAVVVAGVAAAGYYYSTSRPSTSTTSMQATSTPAGRITIGGTVSLAGSLANEGQLGAWGAQASVNWINDVRGGVDVGGKKMLLQYKYYDDESKKELVQSLTEKLITVDKVDLLLGPYSSGLVLGTAPIPDKYGRVMMNWGGATDRIHDQGYKYVVSVWTPASGYFIPVLDMMQKTDPNAKNVAYVYEEDEFSRTVVDETVKVAEKNGFQTVFKKSYPSAARDMTPLLSELKGAKADVVLGGGHFADGQLLTKQMSELEVDAKLISLLVAPALPDYYNALGKLTEGVTGTSQWEIGVKYSADAAKALGMEYFGPSQDEFLQYFKKVAGASKDPSYHAASAAAAVLILAKATEKAASLDQDKVRAALSSLDEMTFFGRFKIDPTTGQQISHLMVLFQWQGGKRNIIWPPEAANAKTLYPIPTWKQKAS